MLFFTSIHFNLFPSEFNKIQNKMQTLQKKFCWQHSTKQNDCYIYIQNNNQGTIYIIEGKMHTLQNSCMILFQMFLEGWGLHGVVGIIEVVYGSPCGRPEKVCLFILPWLALRWTGLVLKRTVVILSWVALKRTWVTWRFGQVDCPSSGVTVNLSETSSHLSFF